MATRNGYQGEYQDENEGYAEGGSKNELIEGLRIGQEAFRDAKVTMEKFADCQREMSITEREAIRADAEKAKSRDMKEAFITKVQEEHKSYRQGLDKIFAQRDKTIDKSFEIIDKGMREDNFALIELGLSKATDIAKDSSPMSQLKTVTDKKNLRNLLESGSLSIE